MAEKDIITVEYDGKEIQASRKACRSFKVIKRMAHGGAGMFDAFDEILLGKSDEVADALGDDVEKVAEACGLAIEKAQAKKLMVLASAMELHPDELRADFQQFYGLNIDDMGEGYTAEHAAALVSQLPSRCRVLAAERPELEWGIDQALLASIEYSLRILVWQNTKDGQKGRRQPNPIRVPGSDDPAEKISRTNREYIDSILGGGGRG